MDLVIASANGSTFLEISKTSFRKIETKIPSATEMQKFHNLVSPIFSKILANTQQIQTLSKIRDTLLPQLMSGRVRVGV